MHSYAIVTSWKLGNPITMHTVARSMQEVPVRIAKMELLFWQKVCYFCYTNNRHQDTCCMIDYKYFQTPRPQLY